MRAAALLLVLAGCSGFEQAKTPVAPSVLVSGLVLPVAVAVNDRHVYWMEFGPQDQGLCGMLSRVDKHAGCAQADAGCIDLLTDMRFLVVSMALAPGDACWIEFYDDMREVHCMSLATAETRRLADNQPYAFNLFTDGANLLWTNGGNSGAIQTTPIGAAQAAVTTLASGLRLPTGVAADADGLYWSEDRQDGGAIGQLMAAGRGGESPRMLATGLASPRALKPFGDYLYFTEENGGRVSRARKDGGGVEVLAENELSPFDLAVDQSGVYWLSSGTPPNYLDGAVVRADLDGGHRVVIAQDQHYLSALAIDDEAVFWALEGTEQANYLDGALWRAPKN